MRKKILIGLLILVAIAAGTFIPHLWNSFKSRPAIAAVNELFGLWQHEKYDEMEKLTTNSGPRPGFFFDILRTPVHFRNLSVGPARKDGNTWFVKVNVEVTDMPPIMTMIYSYEKLDERLNTSRIDMVMAPTPDIESFRKIEQEMRVICPDKAPCLIDICRDGVSCARKSNVMNYVMDAGSVIKTEDEKIRLAAFMEEGNSLTDSRLNIWLVRAIDNLGLPPESSTDLTIESAKLYLKTPQGKLETLLRRFKRLAAPPLPTDD